MTHKLQCIRGDSAAFPLTLTSPATSSTPFDPTGWTLLASFKFDAEDADAGALIQKLSTVGGFTVTDAAAGEVTLALVPSDFAHIDAGVRYVFDVQAQDEVTGEVRTVAIGTLTTSDDVTKDLELTIPTTVVDPAAAYLSAVAVAAKAAEAAASADAAATSESNAAGSEAAAAASETAASASETAAGNSATAAAASAASALSYKNTASAAATAASASQVAAAGSAATAATNAVSAGVSATAAAASQSVALNSESNAAFDAGVAAAAAVAAQSAQEASEDASAASHTAQLASEAARDEATHQSDLSAAARDAAEGYRDQAQAAEVGVTEAAQGMLTMISEDSVSATFLFGGQFTITDGTDPYDSITLTLST